MLQKTLVSRFKRSGSAFLFEPLTCQRLEWLRCPRSGRQNASIYR